MSNLFLTSPRTKLIHWHGEFHPVLVMTRVLLRAGDVAPERLGFVQAFVQSSAFAPHTSRMRTRYLHGFDGIFRELHGTFRLQLRTVTQAESVFSSSGKEIVTLTWLARGRSRPCGVPIITS
jgi:hypothetical protein